MPAYISTAPKWRACVDSTEWWYSEYVQWHIKIQTYLPSPLPFLERTVKKQRNATLHITEINQSSHVYKGDLGLILWSTKVMVQKSGVSWHKQDSNRASDHQWKPDRMNTKGSFQRVLTHWLPLSLLMQFPVFSTIIWPPPYGVAVAYFILKLIGGKGIQITEIQKHLSRKDM